MSALTELWNQMDLGSLASVAHQSTENIDVESVKQDLNKVLHVTCSVFYLYLTYFDWTTLNWSDRPITDKLNKLTNWNYHILTIYWLISTANDILQFEWLTHYLHDLALGIILPCSLVVTGFFWAGYTYDPKLVRSQQAAAICPNWYNHATHTWVLILPVIETWLGAVTISVKDLGWAREFADASLIGTLINWRKLCLFTLWGSSYAFVVFYLGIRRSIWPYPFMRLLSFKKKVIAGVIVFTAGFLSLFITAKVYHFYVTYNFTLETTKPIREPTIWEKTMSLLASYMLFN